MTKKLILLLAIIFMGIALLSAGTYSGGSGTSGDPYQIATTADLIELSNTSTDWVSGTYINQTANIAFDANEQNVDWDGDGSADWDSSDDDGFLPMGTYSDPFLATYDGQGNTISNLYINRVTAAYVGLIGYASGGTYDVGPTIQNLGLINTTITAEDYIGSLVGTAKNATISDCYSIDLNITGRECCSQTIGGLIGSNSGQRFTPMWSTISNCYTTGVINAGASNGTSTIGGLVGYLGEYGKIQKSYSYVSVTATGDCVGGLVGKMRYSNCTVENSYSHGSVNGDGQVGGLVGRMQSDNSSTSLYINNCYSTGIVTGTSYVGGLVGDKYYTAYKCYTNNSFWDTQTSGTETGIGSGSATGITGKTTSAMKTQSVFSDAGWDFTSVWEMIGTNYPKLRNVDDSTLPVELSSFTANTTREGEIELNWVTESEIENIGFIIERKETNTENWTEIASYLTDVSLQGQGSVTYRTEYSYTDNTVEENKQYDYRLADVSYSGEKTYHSVTVLAVETIPVPKSFTLHPAYPNPFNPTTTIRYELITDGHVTLTIYDMMGREVTTLINQHRQTGFHTAQWNAENMSSGTYLIKLTQGENTSTQKIILLK